MSKLISFLKRVNNHYVRPAIEELKRNLELARKQIELEDLYEDWCDKNDSDNLSFSEYKNRMSFDYSDVRSDYTVTNPATGISMMSGIGGIDLAGNMYGSNFSNDYAYQNRPSYDHYHKY